MSDWSAETAIGEAEDSVWFAHQKAARRKQLWKGAGLCAGALACVGVFMLVMGSMAEDAREHDQWLKDNACKITKHREGEWKWGWKWGKYRMYYESGETCYACVNGQRFCE